MSDPHAAGNPDEDKKSAHNSARKTPMADVEPRIG
jgi:hypothetical protein